MIKSLSTTLSVAFFLALPLGSKAFADDKLSTRRDVKSIVSAEAFAAMQAIEFSDHFGAFIGATEGNWNFSTFWFNLNLNGFVEINLRPFFGQEWTGSSWYLTKDYYFDKLEEHKSKAKAIPTYVQFLNPSPDMGKITLRLQSILTDYYTRRFFEGSPEIIRADYELKLTECDGNAISSVNPVLDPSASLEALIAQLNNNMLTEYNSCSFSAEFKSANFTGTSPGVVENKEISKVWINNENMLVIDYKFYHHQTSDEKYQPHYRNNWEENNPIRHSFSYFPKANGPDTSIVDAKEAVKKFLSFMRKYGRLIQSLKGMDETEAKAKLTKNKLIENNVAMIEDTYQKLEVAYPKMEIKDKIGIARSILLGYALVEQIEKQVKQSVEIKTDLREIVLP